MRNANITLGADPEFFLRDVRTGSVVPAIGLLGGTKDKPVQIPGAPPGFTMQEDNVMVEFNIPPCTDEYTFADHIRTALNYLDEHVATVTDRRLERDIRPSRLFAHTSLMHSQARQFGCSPDFNAYRSGADFEPLLPTALEEEDGAWRFAGGHVHVGYHEVIDYDIPHFVVAHFMDLFLGASMVEYEREQGKRGELYGLPGRFRPTSYGIEYRSLSNIWVHDIGISSEVASNALNVFNFLRESSEAEVAEVYGQLPWPSLRDALIKHDQNQLGQIRAFISSNFPRNPIRRYF